MTASHSPVLSTLATSSDGPVQLAQLTSEVGLSCQVCNYGAAIHELRTPDRAGKLDNIVLGYSSLDGYKTDPFFIGATVGRVANRLDHGRFELGGTNYQLDCNNPPHHLHGGQDGWFKRVWTMSPLTSQPGSGVLLSLDSPDGDAGYPGRVQAQVSYLLQGNELHVVMTATTDAPTLVNLAHHSYFNLAGQGDVLGHQLKLNADHYTPGDPVPTGAVLPVEGTCFDFRSTQTVGGQLPSEPAPAPGFDLNYLLRTSGQVFTSNAQASQSRLCEQVTLAAQLSEPTTGRSLELFTNQPGLQFYTGNYLDGRAGSSQALERYSGLCLETQAVPNFINIPDFAKQGLLAPGWTYRHEMLFRFSA